jgi:sporulation protein YlmC with PRC-barrel domain
MTLNESRKKVCKFMFAAKRSRVHKIRVGMAGIAAVVSLLFLSLYPVAVGAVDAKPGEQIAAGQPRVAGTEPTEFQIPASKLIGTKVINQKNEMVGKVSDIIITNDKGIIPYVVVAFGEVLDLTAEELFVIPFEALKHGHRDGICVLDVNIVKELPGDKEKSDWLEVSEDETAVKTEESPLGDYWVEPKVEGNTKVEHYSKALSANAILGADVKNKAGEEVGKLDELIVDLNEGLVVNTVFSADGVFGVGGEHYLLPWKMLTHSREEGKLIANVDKKMLETMPRYEGEKEPASPPPVPGS